MADSRLHVPLDDLSVALGRGRLQRRLRTRQPVIEVRAQRESAGIDHVARTDRRQREAQRLLRLA